MNSALVTWSSFEVVVTAETNTLCGRKGRECAVAARDCCNFRGSRDTLADPRDMLRRVPDQGDHQDGQVKLARVAWSVTALICLVTAAILGLRGYYGYAFVTFAVAVAAAINLGD